MEKTIFFIDGFNLYHSIANKSFNKYKWLDLSELVKKYVTKSELIENIYYFTALTTWSPDKVKRHQIFIRAQESRGVKIIYGEFKRRDKKCPLCHRTFTTFEEKQTDVNIAINLFKLAIKDKYDKAYIISGDSDLIPSINAVKMTFPHKKIGVIIPIGRRAELLKHTCDFHMKMKEKHLSSSMLPNEIKLKNNQILLRPSSWY